VPRQGARHVWSDSRGGLWITGWNSGDLFRYDSRAKNWARWHLPGNAPQPYAVYVDETDAVWLSDWGANAILRFDPKTEKFESFRLSDPYANVRQPRRPEGRSLGCRIRRRQAVRAEGGVGDQSAEPGFASSRRTGRRAARACKPRAGWSTPRLALSISQLALGADCGRSWCYKAALRKCV
jgi:sugar lactone lactonase YvrE